jgi:hypothetical protein
MILVNVQQLVETEMFNLERLSSDLDTNLESD